MLAPGTVVRPAHDDVSADRGSATRSVVLSAKANLAKGRANDLPKADGPRRRIGLAEVNGTVQAVTDGSRRQGPDQRGEPAEYQRWRRATRTPRCGPARRPTLRLGFGGKLVDSAGSSRRAADPDACIRQLNRRCRQRLREPCRTPRPHSGNSQHAVIKTSRIIDPSLEAADEATSTGNR